MAVDLVAIRQALADQIKAGLDDDTNVYPYPVADPQPPSITIYPNTSTYFSYWGTFGPNGNADLMFTLKIDVAAQDMPSMSIKIDRYLAVGDGNASSVVDAVMSDRTVAGTVGDCVVLAATVGDPDTSPGTAELDVQIILSKQNAGA
jgi:hypothetical protein